ncbi:MAG: TonB-dependent receptor, partial [Clostridia bacterium]|nr:TonB-dependent receptor [Clostridia bacterium]
GDLTVTKTSEDGLVEGHKFHLYGTSLSGIPVDMYATTDENGVAHFEDVLIGSGYTLEEVDTAIRYVIPESQTADIEWNKVTNKSFENILKKWRAEVYKHDSEFADRAQGDATLKGAVYGVYDGDELIDTYTTDENGYFITDYYVCGDAWTIREISPSEGYLIDAKMHHVGASAELYTVEHNTVKMDVTEDVIKGSVSVIKHCDDGSTKLETPEVGAEFKVYLTSAGSYDDALETERDHLICDENGYAETKKLPYGTYTVEQIKGWDGREMMKPFTVTITEDGKIYRYIINNAVFESYIKIVKVDAETGKTIPYAGAGFKLYRPDGTPITQSFTYPEVKVIDTFYTNDKGYLITPESLECGNGYYLIEVTAPHGYVLNSDPVYFDVTADDAEDESGITVVEVTKPNMAQKGIIKLYKTGEVFSSVDVTEGIYQPVYSVTGLPGAEYEIRAAEDIVTLDGTVRYTAGDVVDTIITDENGYAESKALYLGKYEIKEIKAPHGMVLSDEVHTVELIYAGQEVEITETSAELWNDRQKITVMLDKLMEQDDIFGIGQNGEITSVVFGLYAAEELTAADGTIIPADGLIEVMTANENGTVVCKSDLPFGSYYLKEIATDEHYILNETKYSFTFEYAGQDIVVVELK